MKLVSLSIIASTAIVSSSVCAQSIAGTWNATVTSPVGVGTPTIVFQVKGDSVTGTMKRPAGEAPLSGTIKGNALKFTYTIQYNSEPMVVTVTATVAGDSLKGSVDFGGLATGDISAKRASTAPPSSFDASAVSRFAALRRGSRVSIAEWG